MECLVSHITRQFHLLKHSGNLPKPALAITNSVFFLQSVLICFGGFSEYTAFTDIRVEDTVCFCDIGNKLLLLYR